MIYACDACRFFSNVLGKSMSAPIAGSKWCVKRMNRKLKIISGIRKNAKRIRWYR